MRGYIRSRKQSFGWCASVCTSTRSLLPHSSSKVCEQGLCHVVCVHCPEPICGALSRGLDDFLHRIEFHGGIHLRRELIMRYDRVNAHILEIVRKNNRLTSEVLGEMAGLPATALSTTTEEAPL